MNVKVNQEDLLDLISKTQNIVEKRTTMAYFKSCPFRS